MKIKTLRTIRFRMTLAYSFFMLIFGLLFILTLNLAVLGIFRQNAKYQVLDSDRQIPQTVQAAFMQKLTDNIVQNVVNRLEKDRIQNEKRTLKKIRQFSFIFLSGYTLVSFLSGYFLAGSMLRPIDTIVSTANKVKDSNEKKLIVYEGEEDELGRLVHTINSMLGRLYISFDIQKQFIEDASHEIKTPLAVIRTNVEVMQDRIDRNVAVDKKEIYELLSLVIEFTEHMSKLTEDLLLLSRNEALGLQEVDIVSSVKNLVEQKKAINQNENIKILFENKAKAHEVQANETLIVRVISNLLDNAIKYSTSGTIAATVYEANGKLKVSIKDQGLGIPESDLPHIFDRFYRVDKSRSRQTGGFGLGLSIVKKILDEHGFQISVSSIVGTGTEFIITF